MADRKGKGKSPAFQFYMGDWMKDGALGMCEPATRGIWIDLLCTMQIEGTGRLTGTYKALARVSRCTAEELHAALLDLLTTGAADVHRADCPALDDGDCTCMSRTCHAECHAKKAGVSQICPAHCHGEVTVINRRLDKAHKLKENSRLRKQRQRSGDAGHADVTPSRARPSSASAKESRSHGYGGYESPRAHEAPSHTDPPAPDPDPGEPAWMTKPDPVLEPATGWLPDDHVPGSHGEWTQWLVNERGWMPDRCYQAAAVKMLQAWVEQQVTLGEARLGAECAHQANPSPGSPCWYRNFVNDAVLLRGKEAAREARQHHRPGRPRSVVERVQQRNGTYWPDQLPDSDPDDPRCVIIDTSVIPH